VNDPHARFQAWLLAGADNEPQRDLALHATVCDACRDAITAFDRLAAIDPGLAGFPPPYAGAAPIARPLRVVRLTGAVAGVGLLAVVVGLGFGQLFGAGGGIAAASATPEDGVLGGAITPQPTATGAATPGPSGDTTVQPSVTASEPFPTPVPQPTPVPATPRPTPRPTAVPTLAPTAAPSPTAVPSPGAPSAPTGLTATPIGRSIQLTWGLPADGGSPIITYLIYRGTASGSANEPIGESSQSLSFTDAAVVPGTTYYYRVTAVNALGESPMSTEASAVIPLSPPTPTGSPV